MRMVLYSLTCKKESILIKGNMHIINMYKVKIFGIFWIIIFYYGWKNSKYPSQQNER